MKFSRTNYPKKNGLYWGLPNGNKKIPILYNVRLHLHKSSKIGFNIRVKYECGRDHDWDGNTVVDSSVILWGDKYIRPKIVIEKEKPLTKTGIEIPLTIRQRILNVGYNKKDYTKTMHFQYYNKKTGVVSYSAFQTKNAYRKSDEHNIWYTIDEVYSTRIDGKAERLETAGQMILKSESYHDGLS